MFNGLVKFQRSHVTVTAKTNGFLWIEDLIDLVETEASCELYGLLKRPDEKHVTEYAYKNPLKLRIWYAILQPN